jgi:hypothetical protein
MNSPTIVKWPTDTTKVYGYLMHREWYYQFDTEEELQKFYELKNKTEPYWDYDGFMTFRIKREPKDFEDLIERCKIQVKVS